MENFGERMAALRKSDRERLDGAVKMKSKRWVWTFKLDEKLMGAVETLQMLDYRAELVVEGDKVRLFAVKYERA